MQPRVKTHWKSTEVCTDVCSHSDKEDVKGSKQKMCLQVENVTEEVEYETVWSRGQGECVQSRRDGSSLSVPGLSTRM